jgi:TPR repeat protein
LWSAVAALLVLAIVALLGWRSRSQLRNVPRASVNTPIGGVMHADSQAALPAVGPATSEAMSTNKPEAEADAVSTRQTTSAGVSGKSPMGRKDQEAKTMSSMPVTSEIKKANDAGNASITVASLQRATKNGDPDAPVRLANMYLKGDGVARSCDKAVALLETAAHKPNVRARNKLAALYAIGTCVQRDRVLAYRWMTSALAADPNNQWATQNRDLMLRQMTADERARAGTHQ